MTGTTPIRRHAITPPVFGREKLHRQRLVEILKANLERRLILVVAPAGYGKTTLMADLTAHIDRPACWVRVTEHDRDPARLWRVVIESLGAKFRRMRRQLDARGLESLPADKIGGWIGRQIGQSGAPPFALMFDDVHLLGGSSESTALVAGLIDSLPEHVCCFLGGREALELPLARAVAANEVLSIGAGDLSFAEDELEAWLKLDGDGEASAEVLERLMSESRGWIAGIQLLRLRGLEALHGSVPSPKELTFDYFGSEVLGRQSDALQRFALESSVLPVMTAEAVEAVCRVEDGARWLRLAVRKGLFLSGTSSSPRTYEYHPLFREFLQKRLEATDSKRARAAKIRAAKFLAKRGEAEQAVELYWEAGETRRALKTAERTSTRLLGQGRLLTLEQWVGLANLADVPAIRIRSSLIDLYAVRGEIGGARTLIRLFLKRYGHRVPPIERYAFEAWDARLQAYHANPRTAIKRAQRILKRIGWSNLHRAGRLAHAAIANAYFDLGRYLPIAERHARAAYRAARAKGGELSQGYMKLLVGCVLNARGSVEEERRLDQELISFGRQFARNTGPLRDEVLGLWAHRDMRWSDALEHLDRGIRSEDSVHYRNGLLHLDSLEVCLDAGFREEARKRYEIAAGKINDISGAWSRLDAHIVMARTCRLLGDIPGAGQWIDGAVRTAPHLKGNLALAAEACAVGDAVGEPNVERRLNSIIRRVRAYHGAPLVEMRARHALAHYAWKVGRIQESLQNELEAVRLGRRIAQLHWLSGELMADPEHAAFVTSGLAREESVVKLISGMESARNTGLSMRTSRAVLPRTSIEGRLFGTLELRLDGQLLRLRPLASEVVAFLIDRQTVHLESVMEAFWPERSLSAQRASLHSAIYTIRKQLGRDTIIRSGSTLSWGTRVFVVSDVREFETLATTALSAVSSGTPSLDEMQRSLILYRGPFVENSSREWAVGRRRQLEMLFVGVATLYGQKCLELGYQAQAVPFILRAVQADPLNERLSTLAARLLAATGRRAHALHVLDEYQATAYVEIGLGPSLVIQDLANGIRAKEAMILSAPHLREPRANTSL